MEDKFLKIATYVCVSITIFLAVKRLIYAMNMWAYTETAFIFLAVGIVLLAMRFIKEI